MSEQTIRRTERIMDLRTAMPWLVAAGIYVLVIAVAPQLLGDPDTYSHLAPGRWILDHGAVPTVDPFSANFRGTHWLAFEWLSEVVFALAYVAGGWMGMVAVGIGCRRNGIRSVDKLPAAGVAADRCAVRHPCRFAAHGSAHSGAAAHPGASIARRMDCGVDPLRRHPHGSVVALAAAHDAMGEPAR